jgi:hypothetical protein
MLTAILFAQWESTFLPTANRSGRSKAMFHDLFAIKKASILTDKGTSLDIKPGMSCSNTFFQIISGGKLGPMRTART